MTQCPDHQALAGFIEQRVPEPERTEIELHVAGCVTCLDIMAAAMMPAATAEQESGAPPMTRTNRPSLRRIWSQAMAAGLALFLTGTVGYLAAVFTGEQIRLAAVRIATERFGTPLEVQSLGFSAGPETGTITVRARQLDLGAFGQAAVAEFDLALGRLGVGTPVLRAVRLFAPEFRWTLSEHESDRPRLREALAAWAMAPTVEIVDAVLHLHQSNGPAIVVEHLSASARRSGARVDVRATATLGAGTLGVHGTVDTEHEPHVDLTIGGRDLPGGILPYVRDWADGRLAVVLRATGDSNNWRLAGRLHLAEASLRGIDPLRDLAASYRLDPGVLSTRATRVADVRATVRIDSSGWRVPRSLLLQGDLETRMIAHSTTAASVLGEGFARLPEDRATALIALNPLFRLYGTRRGRLLIPFRVQGEAGRAVVVRE